MLHKFEKHKARKFNFYSFFMRPDRTNSVKKNGNASRLKKRVPFAPLSPKAFRPLFKIAY